jgi:heme exporter protein C
MRNKTIYVLSALAILLLVRNLHAILLQVPDDIEQGPIYRIIYFHVPAAFTAFTGFFAALVASVMYLATKNFRYDAMAVAITEVSLAFAAVNLVTGSIWARVIWGIWWTWDARLTTMFICFLLYLSYLVLRTAIDEPTQRAKMSAVVSIFAFADVPIVWYSIEWFRTQHPQPVLRGGGQMDPFMKSTMYSNWPALMLVAVILILLRLRQEEMRREIDGLRRLAHAV